MAQKIQHIVYPAQDLQKTKKLFDKFLAVEPYVDEGYYVGYRFDGMEVGLDPKGTAIVAYTDVADIESSLKMLADAGASIYQAAKDVGGGLLIAKVKDASGNILGLRQQSK